MTTASLADHGAVSATAHATQFIITAALTGNGALGGPLPCFLVTGEFSTLVNPSLNAASNAVVQQPLASGYVSFTPRVARGQIFFAGDSAFSLQPITAQILNGVLTTLDYAGTAGVQLVSNFAALGLNCLIYDVRFTGGAECFYAPFAFVAPVDSTPVDLTSASLVKLPYVPPSAANWQSRPTGPRYVDPRYWRRDALLRS